MEAYRFKTTVETDSSVHLAGLPPEREVEIVVMERNGLSDEFKEWLRDIRARHPFTKMSKEEILESLRKTREEVWAERHADKP